MTEEKKGCCCGEENEAKESCCGGNHEVKEETGSCCGGNHEKGGCCGEHGHDHDHDHDEEEVPVLHLELEDGSEMPCYVLEILDIEETSYIALLPEGEDTFMIYQYAEEGEEVNLSNIENDDEYLRIANIFEAHFDESAEEAAEEE
jgi:uncharacterized protein YrzB (UPF0473 family)